MTKQIMDKAAKALASARLLLDAEDADGDDGDEDEDVDHEGEALDGVGAEAVGVGAAAAPTFFSAFLILSSILRACPRTCTTVRVPTCLVMRAKFLGP